MKTTIAAWFVLLAPLSAGAQELKPVDIKPGLWETTFKSQVSGMQMPQIPPERLAQLPPEQRARIEGMMNGRGSASTTTNKSCITREMLNRGLMFHHDNSCTYKTTSSSSSSQQMHVECTRNDTKTVGDLNIDRVDSEHVKGSMVMKVTGKMPVNMNATFETKFLSSDCGDVKPEPVK